MTDITPQRIAIELGFEHNRPETWQQSLISMISLIIKRVPQEKRHDTLGLTVRTCQHFSRLDQMGLITDHNAEWRRSSGKAEHAMSNQDKRYAPRYGIRIVHTISEPQWAVLQFTTELMRSDFGMLDGEVERTVRVLDTEAEARALIAHMERLDS